MTSFATIAAVARRSRGGGGGGGGGGGEELSEDVVNGEPMVSLVLGQFANAKPGHELRDRVLPQERLKCTSAFVSVATVRKKTTL